MDIWMSENAKNLDIILQNLKETLVLVMYVTLKVVWSVKHARPGKIIAIKHEENFNTWR